jgi:IS5 family transposase
VTLALAARALRGFSKGAESTQPLRRAQELLASLLAQDIDETPEDGGGPEIRRGTARDRIVSTTDPEMRHGHKSHSKGFDGYKAAIVADTDSGMILSADVRAGNVHDKEGASFLAEAAAVRADRDLAEVLGDTAYGDLATRAALELLGAEVVAKAPPGTRKGMFDRTDFRIDSRRGIARCPAGERTVSRRPVPGDDPGWTYVFSRKSCTPCSLRAQCTKSRTRSKELKITEQTEALWKLRKQQRTKRFRRRYRKRVAVEHRLGRLVQLGIRQAKYFGSAKVGFQVALAATVANLGLVAALGAEAGVTTSALLAAAIACVVATVATTAPAEPAEMAPSRPGF